MYSWTKFPRTLEARKSPIDKFTCYLPVTQVFFKKLWKQHFLFGGINPERCPFAQVTVCFLKTLLSFYT